MKFYHDIEPSMDPPMNDESSAERNIATDGQAGKATKPTVYGYGGNWHRFHDHVRTYVFVPIPKMFCQRRPNHCDITGERGLHVDYYGFTIGNGMANGEFLTIKHLSPFGRLEQYFVRSLLEKSLLPQKAKLKTGDVLLSMNGFSLCGSGANWPYHLMQKLWTAREVLAIQVISAEVLGSCLKVGSFLNCLQFPKSTIQYEIQLNIRFNVYSLSAPITNRPPRITDLAREDGGYLIADNNKLCRWLQKDLFLEKGEYEGHFYGTIYPFYYEWWKYEEDHWQFFPAERIHKCTTVPFRGRSTSYKKAIGMMAKNSEEKVSALDMDPRLQGSVNSSPDIGGLAITPSITATRTA